MAISDLSGRELEEVLRHHFLMRGIASGPAKPEEIDAVEESLGCKLPAAYRAYLGVCGHEPPRSLVGSDCTIGFLRMSHEWGVELLAENALDKELLNDCVVFFMHQGYQFSYFPLDGSDDPPVFHYIEGLAWPERKFERFSHWVLGLGSEPL